MLIFQSSFHSNPKSNTLACSKTGGRYCVSGSLNGPIMLSCLSKTLVEVRSYNIECVTAVILPMW